MKTTETMRTGMSRGVMETSGWIRADDCLGPMVSHRDGWYSCTKEALRLKGHTREKHPHL